MPSPLQVLPRTQFEDAAAVHAAITATAEQHGRSSKPDHEVGDLQDALGQAIELLTPALRVQLLRDLASTTFDGEGGDEISFCRTDGCPDDPDDGEGFDGYCGDCADARAH